MAKLALLVCLIAWSCAWECHAMLGHILHSRPVVKEFTQIEGMGSSKTESMPFPETLLSIQKFTLEPCATYSLHTHPSDEVYYVAQGAAIAGAITKDGVVMDTLTAGKGVLTRAGVPHFIYNNKCDPMVAYSSTKSPAPITFLALDKVGSLSGEARDRHNHVSGPYSVYEECKKRCK